MKKISILAVAVVAAMLGGCKSTMQDIHVSDMNTEMVSAKFKPQVQVIGDSVTGSATANTIFWGWWATECPDKFANQMTSSFGFSFGNPIKDAAVYDACNKAGADILLAPVFTVKKETGFLWFKKNMEVTVKGIPAKITGAEEIPFEKWCELMKQPGCVTIKTREKE